MKVCWETTVAAYYSINHESPIVKSIEQFNNTLIENILGNETLYEIHDYLKAQGRSDAGDMIRMRGDVAGGPQVVPI